MSRAPLGRHDDEARVDALLATWAQSWSQAKALLGVEHQSLPDDRGHFHWLVRLRGDERDVVTVWLALRQRTIHVECEISPAPEANVEEIYRFVLAKNAELRELHVALGPEAGLYLMTHVPINELTNERLDELMGAALVYVDELYPTIMSTGFSWYRRRPRRESSAGSVEQ